MATKLHMTQNFYHFLERQHQGELELPILTRPSGYFFVELSDEQVDKLIRFLQARVDHWRQDSSIQSGHVRSAIRLLMDLGAYE